MEPDFNVTTTSREKKCLNATRTVNDGIEARTANATIKHLSDSNNEPSKTTDIYLLFKLDLNILHFFLFKVQRRFISVWVLFVVFYSLVAIEYLLFYKLRTFSIQQNCLKNRKIKAIKYNRTETTKQNENEHKTPQKTRHTLLHTHHVPEYPCKFQAPIALCSWTKYEMKIDFIFTRVVLSTM